MYKDIISTYYLYFVPLDKIISPSVAKYYKKVQKDIEIWLP